MLSPEATIKREREREREGERDEKRRVNICTLVKLVQLEATKPPLRLMLLWHFFFKSVHCTFVLR
jgi:hypothetical protein